MSTPSPTTPIPRGTDPRELGCRCDECPLGDLHRQRGTFRPVLPEIHGGEQITVVGEAPGFNEENEGFPFVGRSGDEFETWLSVVGLSRSQVAIDNVLLCRPPDNNIDLIEALARTAQREVAEDNARRRKARLPLRPMPLSPIEACRPHVQRSVLARPYALLLGSTAWSGVTGTDRPIRKIRGAFMDLRAVDTDDGIRLIPFDRLPRDADGTLAVATVGQVRAVPTYHPAFVLRAMSARLLTIRDLDRLVRWKDDRLDWPPLTNERPMGVWVKHNPSPEELEEYIYGRGYEVSPGVWESPRWPVGIDVETDALESLTARMRTICFSSQTGGMVIHFRSVSGQIELGDGFVPKAVPGAPDPGPAAPQRFYPPAIAARMRALVQRILSDPQVLKAGHNWNYFDEQIVIREVPIATWTWAPTAAGRGLPGAPPAIPFDHVGLIPGMVWDSAPGARADQSELPRDLYTTGTRTTDVPAWKEANDEKKISTHARSDKHLGEYNVIDGTVTRRGATKLLTSIRARNVEQVVNLDFRAQHVMREMHALGMRVNETARKAAEIDLSAKRHVYREKLRDLIGESEFNPASDKQLRRVFLDQFRLPTIKRSETSGLPSMDDDVLRTYRRMRDIPSTVHDFIDWLRKFRKVSKELGTYILPLRRVDDLRMNRDKVLVGGLTFRNGRIHPHYGVHVPATGRKSSSNPNIQNIPKHLRKLFIPEDGNCYTGADFDQIELRLVSGIAGVEAYLIVFREDGDPHATTAILIYGDYFKEELRKSLTPEQWASFMRTGSPLKAKGGTKTYEELRRFAKTFVYAVIYGGTARTIFESVSSAEDDDGNLLFPTMTIEDVQVAYDQWMSNAREVPLWWKQLEEFCRANGYVREPIMGRIRDFPIYSPTEVPNHPIQGGAAAIMTLGTCRLRDVMPPDYERYHGIVGEFHDAVLVEHPDTDFARRIVKEQVEEALTLSFPSIPDVTFTATAEHAYSWDKA